MIRQRFNVIIDTGWDDSGLPSDQLQIVHCENRAEVQKAIQDAGAVADPATFRAHVEEVWMHDEDVPREKARVASIAKESRARRVEFERQKKENARVAAQGQGQ